MIYCSGLGTVSNMPQDGAAAVSAVSTTNGVQVTIGGQPAAVTYAGLTPGSVGLYQVNAQVPVGLTAGDAVPVNLSAAGQTSLPATMALR